MPVAVVVLTTWIGPSSMLTAYRMPSPWSTLLRGDRYAHTVTGPAVKSVMVYARCGPSPPGARLAAVAGNAFTPSPVRPRSSMDCQTSPASPTARDEALASIATYPCASMKPRSSSGGTAGLSTTAATPTARPAPVTVIGTSEMPVGAPAQSTETIARNWVVTVPWSGVTVSQGTGELMANSNGAL